MNFPKRLKRLFGEVFYRIRPKGASSVGKVRHHPAFAALGVGDIVIDCGANVGLVTEVMAAHGATVHAFEPNPDAFAALQRRFTNAENVILYPQAVFDKAGSMRLHLHLNYHLQPERFSQGSSLLADKRNVAADGGVEVAVIDFAAFVLSLPGPVKVLKMDIEGAEYAVLNRLIDTGAIDRIETILVETHAGSIPSLREADSALRQRIAAAGLGGKIDLGWI